MHGIFMKIIQGEIPCFKLWEDELTFAFLDIRPVHLGHSLVIPKKEVDHFLDVEEPYYSAVFQTAKKIAPAIQKATQCKRIGTSIVGFEVPHFHYHLIPLWSLKDMDFTKACEREKELMEDMQRKILSHL